MLRHYDQDERQRDGSRHWDPGKPVLMKAFAHKGARDFDDGYWLRLIHEGSTKKRLEYCQDKDGNLCYFRAIQGHSGGIPISPELMKYTPISYDWKKYLFHKGICQWVFQSILVSGIIQEKRGGQSSSSCLSDSLESFWKGPGRGEASFLLHSSPKKLHMKPNGNATKMLCIGYDWKKRRIKDRILANEIIRNHDLLHDTRRLHIDRVTAQDGDRVLFERLATPRPAPKVTLKRNWQSQQQQQEQQPQQPISHTDVLSGNREQHGKARQKCKTTRNTSQKRTKPPRNWQQTTSDTNVDTHLSDKEVSTTREERSCERRIHRYEYKGHWKNQNWFM